MPNSVLPVTKADLSSPPSSAYLLLRSIASNVVHSEGSVSRIANF